MTWVLKDDGDVLTDDDGDPMDFGTEEEATEKKTELNGLFSNLEVEQQGVEEVKPEVITMSDNTGGNNSDNGDNGDNQDNVENVGDGDNDEPLPGVDVCSQCGAEINDGHCPDCDGEDTVDTKAIETAVDKLPDEKPGVDTDPLDWVPGDFVDTIEGQQAINRKGFEVICQHYGISIETELVESPTESDWDSCIHKATAVTQDGVEYTAYGSAHVDRGDDKTLLIEMSDTRSYKRAASRATGIGMVAVEELKGASL